MADYTLDIYKDRRGEFRWRRLAANGKIVGASSEGYRTRKDCEANASRNTAEDRWEFYRDRRGGYRWRCFSTANKRQVGKATEAFSSKASAENNARINGWPGKDG